MRLSAEAESLAIIFWLPYGGKCCLVAIESVQFPFTKQELTCLDVLSMANVPGAALHVSLFCVKLSQNAKWGTLFGLLYMHNIALTKFLTGRELRCC